MNKVRFLGILSCLAAALLFGASTPVSKVLLGSLGPFGAAGLLYLGAALAMGTSASGSFAQWRISSREERMRLLGAVAFGGGIGPVLLMLGLRTAPAASVAIWLNLETVATTVLAGLLFREHIGLRVGIAAGMVVLAGVLLAGVNGFAAGPAALWVGLACVAWGLDNNLTASIQSFSPRQTTFVKGLAAGAVNLALGVWMEGVPGEWGIIGGALLTGAFAYGVSIALYIHGAQRLGAARSQMWFSTAPLAGIALSWVALGEPVLPEQIWAAGIMAAGLTLLLVARHGHGHIHGPQTHTHGHLHDDGHHTHVHSGTVSATPHTHPHSHEPVEHAHPHDPDLHHRHEH